MAKAVYLVTVILPGRREDYFSFKKGNIAADDTGDAAHLRSLTATITVPARSKRDAEDKVRQMHPGHSIDSSLTLPA